MLPQDDPTSWRDRIGRHSAQAGGTFVKIASIGLLVYVVAMSIFAFAKYTTTKSMLLSHGISDATSTLLAWAVMFIGIGIPGLAILRLFIFRGRLYDYGAAMILPLIFWGMAQIPANFDAKTGKPLKFCSSRPDGTLFCLDHPGIDPLTQQKLLPINQQIADIEFRKDKGLAPKRIARPVADIVFFDPLTGQPKVWVSKSNQGCFDMFDNRGINPQTGEELHPVNAEIVRSIKECPGKALAESARIALQAKETQEKQAAQAIESQRLAIFKSLINCSARATTAIGIKSASHTSGAEEISTAVAEQLASTARASSVSVASNFFHPQFFSEGYFERVYSGDIKPLQEAGAFACINTVWLGQLESSCGQVVNGVMTCDLRLTYRVVDRNGRTLDSGSVSAVGPGFDKIEALQNGTTRLIDTKSSQILRSIKGG